MKRCRTSRTASTAVSVALTACLAACSTSDGGSDAGPPPTGELGAVSGAFVFTLEEANAETPGQTTLVGKVSAGSTPALWIWEEAAKEGPCQLLTPRIPRCDPPCVGGEVCVEDDTCQGHPAALGVGKVHVEGLKVSSGEAQFTG